MNEKCLWILESAIVLICLGNCWYDYSGGEHCYPVPYGHICTNHYGKKYCRPGTTIITTPPPPVCWYDYSGGKHCYPVPYGYVCTDHNGLKYCQPGSTTPPTTPNPALCWYDYQGGKHCYPVPPCSVCTFHNGLKYCHVPTTTPAPTRSPYDCCCNQYVSRGCYPAPTNCNCQYPTGSTCYPYTTPTIPPTPPSCYYGPYSQARQCNPSITQQTDCQYGRQNCQWPPYGGSSSGYGYGLRGNYGYSNQYPNQGYGSYTGTQTYTVG